MTLQQGLAFAVVIGMMALFVWGKLRYDLVALLALFVAVIAGIVPAEEAFEGFSDDIVIIVASALLVSAAVARSGIVEVALQKLGHHLTSERVTIVVLVGAVTLLSAFVKNIGALAMLMPVAFQIARRSKTSPSLLADADGLRLPPRRHDDADRYSPNVIVSRMREDLVGELFRDVRLHAGRREHFELGVVFLALGYKLLPPDAKALRRSTRPSTSRPTRPRRMFRLNSSLIGKTVADLEALGDGEVEIITIIREKFRRYTPSPGWSLERRMSSFSKAIRSARARRVSGGLRLAGGEEEEAKPPRGTENIGVMEAVVTAEFVAGRQDRHAANLADHYQMGLLAVSRSGERLSHRLRTTRFQAGDVIVLQGDLTRTAEALGDLRCLPLASRDIRLGVVADATCRSSSSRRRCCSWRFRFFRSPSRSLRRPSSSSLRAR